MQRAIEELSGHFILCGWSDLAPQIARELRMECIAEGVETAEQHEFIRAEGCSFSQGFLYSRPLPQQELEDFLRGHNAPVAQPA